MADAKHTPGPWVLHEVGGDYGSIKSLCPASADGQSILTITEEGDAIFGAVLKAPDARLIAAAPELLDALKDAAELLRRVGPGYAAKDQAHIRSVIAKATGT